MVDAIKRILLCSQHPIFIKGVYGALRDAGYQIETSEHPAGAVRSVFDSSYSVVILDSRDIGLNASDAAMIIRTVRPDIPVVLIGTSAVADGLYSVENPDEVDRIKEIISSISVSNDMKEADKGGIYEHDAERDRIKSL
ncbi:MAG: hypothetical protein EPN22_15490 [Nitrospirae bacterium]|nr:MAG: hypothetical protein EPN22_15490 [Nitrospirota bacterium]